jgi:hypothetical protein
MWCYQLNRDINTPRTNNAIEGWHNVFANTFGTSKYSFSLLIEKLKNEEDSTRIKFLRFEAGHTFRRNKKYVEMENSIFEYLNVWSNREFGVEFVFGLVDKLFY